MLAGVLSSPLIVALVFLSQNFRYQLATWATDMSAEGEALIKHLDDTSTTKKD